MKIKKWILNSKLVGLIYRFKFNLDLGIAQISWFTGKLPEVMSFVYLSEKLLSITFDLEMIVILGICVIGGLELFGWIWKHSGIYDVEVYVNANKNPVQKEIIEGIRHLRKKFP